MRGRSIISSRRASSSVEFALVLPLLLLLLFTIIDVGRWLYVYNRAEKATQMGARLAVVAYPAAGGNSASGINASYLGVGGLTQGDSIPASAFGKVTCTSSGCTCTTTPCPSLGTFNAAFFNPIVDRIRLFLPEATAANVTVEYSSSGLGYAGNPNGADLAPIVTVRLSNMTFRPVTGLALFTMTMPAFHTSLTFEDGVGAQSN